MLLLYSENVVVSSRTLMSDVSDVFGLLVSSVSVCFDNFVTVYSHIYCHVCLSLVSLQLVALFVFWICFFRLFFFHFTVLLGLGFFPPSYSLVLAYLFPSLSACLLPFPAVDHFFTCSYLPGSPA